jgi:very-short-patch-repair endonuclease
VTLLARQFDAGVASGAFPFCLHAIKGNVVHALSPAVSSWLASGLVRPLRQQALRLPSGDEIHPDFYWPTEGEIVEVDHVTWHGGRASSAYDKRRDRHVRRLGIGTTRITDIDIRDELPSVVADIAALLRRSDARRVS